jgi:predicted aspartyl protease
LIDPGAGCSVITPEMAQQLQPPRSGTIYVEGYKGKGDFNALYRVDIEIHNWIFREVEVIVGDSHYAILGRDILNHFDLRLNGIDGKLEFLRGPQSQIVF